MSEGKFRFSRLKKGNLQLDYKIALSRSFFFFITGTFLPWLNEWTVDFTAGNSLECCVNA